MKSRIGVFLYILWPCFAGTAAAYEKLTHENLSDKALTQSPVRRSDFSGLGLARDFRNGRKFPNPDGDIRPLDQTLTNGAQIEDDQLRPANHFFTPSSGFGLLNLFTPTPDWALEDKGDILQMITDGWSVPAQEYSLKDARTSFYDALTNPDLTQRRAQWGRTFQTLGQAMHLLQEMAQPRHVRIDGHLNEVFV